MTSGDAVWTAPRVGEGVRCGSCGAHTPVYGAGDPTCMYCGMPVDLPSDVRVRLEKHARGAQKARGERGELELWLTTEGRAYISLIVTLQLAGLCLSLAAWLQLMARAQRAPTPLHWLLIASCFVGPILLWVVAQHRRFDVEVRKAAKLAFARLEVDQQPTGIEMHLSCSSCGGALDATRIRGLTIRCTQCKNAMLAPSRLVKAGEKRLLKQAAALRQRLGRGSDIRTAISVAGALLYIGTFAWIMLTPAAFADDLTLWLTTAFMWVFGLSIIWNFSHSHSGWDRFWIGFMLSALPLAGVMYQVLIYVEKMG
jgi:hypothetical protein